MISQETTMDHTDGRVFGSQSPPISKTMTRKKKEKEKKNIYNTKKKTKKNSGLKNYN